MRSLVFDWEDQPGAYKYILTIIRPDLVKKSMIAWNSSAQVEASVLEMIGIYQWSVTAFDASLQPICSAGPWAFTQPGVSLSTPTAPNSGNCISLLAPASGVNFPGPARVDFNWSEYPAAYKYAVTFRPPTGGDVTFLAWKPPYTRYVESFIEGGTYQWWVTVKNSNMQVICSSQVFTFTKPKTVLTTPTAAGELFWERQGPSGTQTSCASLHFSVKSSNPTGGMIKVVYSPNNVPEGSIDPNIVIGAAGTFSGSGDLTLPNKGQTKYWRFAIYKDGVYTLNSQIFNFTCPNPTVSNQPPTFSNQSGPTGTQSSCASLNFSVTAVNPTGGMIKMIYSTNSIPDGNVDSHIVIGNTGATSGSGSLSLADNGKTYFWRFAIYDGTYIHDPKIFSFTCPMPASQGPSFTGQSGPTGVQSSCSALGFSVNTTLSGTIKVVYSTDASNLGSIPAYFAIGSGPGSGSGSQDFSSYSGQDGLLCLLSVQRGPIPGCK